MWWVIGVVATILVGTALFDITQRKHAILRNFPVIGHFRYWLEMVGPELRQYIVTDNDEERPFSRDQRRWVYASSKQENNYFGFGTDNDLEQNSNFIIVKHSQFPLSTPHRGEPGYDPQAKIACGKILGGPRGRAKAFRPQSVVNVSGMSFGSISAPAVEAMNRGCQLCGALQWTGEGALSPHHLHGGDVVFQIGTAYFGCRDEQGRFNLQRLVELTEQHPQIKALEIKLSQGAKPGLGGLLPGKKVTAEIARVRGIRAGVDCASPSSHTAFRSTSGLLDFAEELAGATGLPVGIKSAVGDVGFWHDLASQMAGGGRGIDFVAIDGGEGGTGAAPLTFSDHVSLPFKIGFSRVYRVFAEHGLQNRIVFIGSGRLGFPETSLLAFALGCDMVSVAREAMLAIGCIQAQKCHTNHCPTGVATQNAWLMRGLDPTLKSVRLANYIVTLRRELLALCYACGVDHPAKIDATQIEILDSVFGSRTAAEVFGYDGLSTVPNSI